LILNSNPVYQSGRRAAKKPPARQPALIDLRKNGSRSDREAWMRDKQERERLAAKARGKA
jgi:hypothetical protein